MRAEIARLLHFHVFFFKTSWFCHNHADFSFVVVNGCTGIISGLMYSLPSYGHFISVTSTIILSSSS